MTNIENRPAVGLSTESPKRGPKREKFFMVRSEAINKFADMGLSGKEISFAVEIETGIGVSPRDVSNLINAARRRGVLRRLTLVEKQDIAKTVSDPWHFTDNVILEDVKSILKHIKNLEERRKSFPANRLDFANLRPSQNRPQSISMEDGVRDGNQIIFPDGRHVPTFKGLRHSEEQKKKVRSVHTGQLEPVEKVRKSSRVYELVAPFCLRVPEISVIEYAQITKFTKTPLTIDQIKRALSRKRRPAWHNLPVEFYQKENVLKRKKRKARVNLVLDKEEKGQLSLQQQKKLIEERKNQRIIAHFLESGFFGWDLSVWNRLEGLFMKNNKQFMGDSIMCLRLEIFFAAIEQARKGDPSLFNQYKEFGKSVDPSWFNSLSPDECFIATKSLEVGPLGK